MLEPIGWEIPICPECGEPMYLTFIEFSSTSFDEAITDARADFIHCSPLAMGHQFVSAIYGDPNVCVRCGLRVGMFAPGPCEKDPVGLQRITFRRSYGDDSIEV